MDLSKAINALKQKIQFAQDVLLTCQGDEFDIVWWQDYKSQLQKAIEILRSKSE